MELPPSLQILFLEDDTDTRDMVTMLLSQSDIEVAAVGTPGEVMIMSGTKPFSAFLLDGITPNGDSIRLCRLLTARYPERPVVFYTAVADPSNIEKAMAAGASVYLIKPYFGDLADVLTRAVADSVPRLHA